MKHIKFYSGGIGSWKMTKRSMLEHGLEDTIMLFTDTLIEGKDVYRFLLTTTQEITGIDQSDLIEMCDYIPEITHETMGFRKEYLIDLARRVTERNPYFVWIADGRDPWEVFKDVRWIGNSRTAQCSHLLKQEMAARWIEEHFNSESPMKADITKKEFKNWNEKKIQEFEELKRKEWEENTKEKCVLYLGIDWSEDHRKAAPIKNWHPYRVEFPMCDEPYIDKNDMLDDLKLLNIDPPDSYGKGFSHSNCSNFCVRAGQGHFVKLLQTNPELYRYHEEKEQEMREFLGKDYSILRRQKNKIKEYITLRQLREEYEVKSEDIDMDDIGGCGCFVSDDSIEKDDA